MQLSVEGFTNEAIAHRLGLSVGTVNTYWTRIRLKVGGSGRTDTVAKIISQRAEKSIEEAKRVRQQPTDIFDRWFVNKMEQQAAMALLKIAASISRSMVWAVDLDFVICFAENCDTFPWPRDRCKAGNSIADVFDPDGPESPIIDAHRLAVSGEEASVQVESDSGPLTMRAIPLRNEYDEIMGCVGILSPAY